MSWAMAAQMAGSFASSWYTSYIQKAQYDAQNTINEGNAFASNLVNNTNAKAANDVRGANNAFQAAQASLQNTQRSIGNREKLSSLGDQWNAIETNQGRIMDSLTRGSLSVQLKAAATLGALRSQAASRGVGGSSSAIMRSVASIASGHVMTQAADNKRYVTYDALLQRAGLLRAGVNSLDMGQSLPQLDYGINVAPLAQAPLNPGDYINPARTAMLSMLTNNAGSITGLAEKGYNAWNNGGKLVGIGESGGGSLNASLGSSSDMASTSSYFNMA